MDTKDHDILIEIKTQVIRLISDVKELKDETAKRVEVVERDKLSKEEFEIEQTKHDEAHSRYEEQIERSTGRIDFLISKYWWAVGVGAAISVVFGLVSTYILQHLP